MEYFRVQMADVTWEAQGEVGYQAMVTRGKRVMQDTDGMLSRGITRDPGGFRAEESSGTGEGTGLESQGIGGWGKTVVEEVPRDSWIK